MWLPEDVWRIVKLFMIDGRYLWNKKARHFQREIRRLGATKTISQYEPCTSAQTIYRTGHGVWCALYFVPYLHKNTPPTHDTWRDRCEKQYIYDRPCHWTASVFDEE
jgi:hypothetical protein